MSTASHLEKLNGAQRKAVTHGEADRAARLQGRPAGWWSPARAQARPKRWRIASRIWRSTASIPRASSSSRSLAAPPVEMRRRAHDIVKKALNEPLGGVSHTISQRLTWAGTFHSIGNRLLRHYGRHLKLDPQFTVVDRADAAELLEVARAELGLASREQRFPRKETCLQIYSCRVNTRKTPAARRSRSIFPGARSGRRISTRLVPRLRRAQAALRHPRLRRRAALLARDDGGGAARAARERAFRSRAGRRLSGHEPPAGGDRPRAQARRLGAGRGGRRRAGRSARSAPPRATTSWDFRSASRRPPKSLRSRRTTAPRSRCWMAPMRCWRMRRARAAQASAVAARQGHAPGHRHGRRSAGAGRVRLHRGAEASRGERAAASGRPCCSAASSHGDVLEVELSAAQDSRSSSTAARSSSKPHT